MKKPAKCSRSKPTAPVTVAEIAAAVRRFRDERDWAQFHTPKNLAEAITAKLAANAAKYPVKLARGNARKYTELRDG